MKIARPLPAAVAALAAALAVTVVARAETPAAPALAPSAPAAGEGVPAQAAPLLLIPDPAPPQPALAEMKLDPALGRFVAPYGKGRAILTIDPRLQAQLVRVLASNAVPWGATILLEPGTGRVVAMAEHAESDPRLRGGVLRARPLAASIFKIVTAAALLERGVDPQESICFHGGQHRLDERLLADDPRRDGSCLTLAKAFSHSANVVFAKLADRTLAPAELRAEADRFL